MLYGKQTKCRLKSLLRLVVDINSQSFTLFSCVIALYNVNAFHPLFDVNFILQGYIINCKARIDPCYSIFADISIVYHSPNGYINVYEYTYEQMCNFFLCRNE